MRLSLTPLMGGSADVSISDGALTVSADFIGDEFINVDPAVKLLTSTPT